MNSDGQARNPMAATYKIVEGAYLRDLLSQPSAISDTVASLRRTGLLHTDARKFQRIVLTGMGSSLHVLHPLLIRLNSFGFTAMMVETSELVHAQCALLDGRTLIVAVSQSGRSAETVLLLDKVATLKDKPTVIGVTNTADSPLAQRADETVLLHAGVESTVSCKTYVATLAALEWLGATICGEDTATVLSELDSSTQAVQAYLSHWRDHVHELSTELQGLKQLFLVGRGISLAASGTGALILKESTRFHAEGMSSAAFRHGPLEMVGSGLLAVVFRGSADVSLLNENLARDIRSAAGKAALVGEPAGHSAEHAGGVFSVPVASERVRPIMEILPVQMLTLALSALTGREAGVFERATKVTDTE